MNGKFAKRDPFEKDALFFWRGKGTVALIVSHRAQGAGDRKRKRANQQQGVIFMKTWNIYFPLWSSKLIYILLCLSLWVLLRITYSPKIIIIHTHTLAILFVFCESYNIMTKNLLKNTDSAFGQL